MWGIISAQLSPDPNSRSTFDMPHYSPFYFRPFRKEIAVRLIYLQANYTNINVFCSLSSLKGFFGYTYLSTDGNFMSLSLSLSDIYRNLKSPNARIYDPSLHNAIPLTNMYAG